MSAAGAGDSVGAGNSAAGAVGESKAPSFSARAAASMPGGEGLVDEAAGAEPSSVDGASGDGADGAASTFSAASLASSSFASLASLASFTASAIDSPID